MKTIIMSLLMSATLGRATEGHDYWYNANKKLISLPYTDVAWNYCDMKCITFEKQYPGYDFFVVNFQANVLKPNFSACYVKKDGDTGNGRLWNTVASNDWFEKNCGAQTIDYYTSSKYVEDGPPEGLGIGALIVY